MKILIAGCGDIGSRAGLELAAGGHEVYGLKRGIESIPDGINQIQADLFHPLPRKILPGNIDQVIYILAASEFSEQAYRRAYIVGVRNLADALENNLDLLNKFIFVSSSSVYAQSQGEWVDEDSPTEPARFNGQVMLEAERQVQLLPGGLCVRFSGIYGPGRTKLINQVRAGQLAPAEPVIFTNRIHVHDCARVLEHLSLLPADKLERNVFVASDNRPASLHEVHHWLADELDVPQAMRITRPVQRRAGSKRLDNQRLLSTGFEFNYPDYRAGYQSVLESWNNH